LAIIVKRKGRKWKDIRGKFLIILEMKLVLIQIRMFQVKMIHVFSRATTKKITQKG